MKLYNIKDINGFFETVNGCTGNVNVVLKEEVINLKDNIKTYSNIFSTISPDKCIEELDIKTDNAEDTMKLLKFAIKG